MVASAVGVVVAAGGFIAVYSVIGEPGDVLFPILMAGVGGVLGALQQHVLRWVLGAAGGWALATGVGLGVGIGLGVATEPETQRAGDRHGRGSGVGVGRRGHRRDAAVARAAHRRGRGAVVGAGQHRRLGGGRVGRRRRRLLVDGLGIAVFLLVAAAVTGVPLAFLLDPHIRATSSTGELGTG